MINKRVSTHKLAEEEGEHEYDHYKNECEDHARAMLTAIHTRNFFTLGAFKRTKWFSY